MDSISAVPGDISLSPYMLLVCMQYERGLHYVHARNPSLKSWLRPLGAYVLVITPLGGMLLVYRPETRGRVAPEGGGSINRNIPTRGVIISL